jgi:LEA14-like dessication related protein
MIRAGYKSFFIAILLVGCAGLSKKPEISLAGIDLVGLGLVEQRLVLKLRIRNPNDADMPVNALNFDVELEGRHFANGISEMPLIVPRQGESTLEVKVTSRLGGVLKPLRDALKNGRNRIGYRVYGRVELEGSGSIPFERSGEVPLSALERVRSGPSRDDRPL